jgi:hypothetical protein
MALIKFNRTATKATATGPSRDEDTLYFPTDEQSIYLDGERVGGDSVSHAENADYATNADHAITADSATTAGAATSAETAEQVGHALTLKLNSGSAIQFDGSAAVEFNVTPSGIGAAAASHNHDSTYSNLNHTHDIDNITHAGAAAKKGVDDSISNFSSANLPTSDAVRAYVTSQIKNYTSAFRYAGTIKWIDSEWHVRNIPPDISVTDRMDYDTFVGSSEDDSLLKVGFTFYVTAPEGEEFVNGEIVETGDMVTCVGLYDKDGNWEPSYQIVNSNITVTEIVDESTKVPTSNAVKTAISSAVSSAVNGLDGTAIADTNYVLTGVTENDGKIERYSQVAVDQTYSSASSNPASGKSIAAAMAALTKTLSAASGKAITGITQTNGLITSITEAAFNNYTHPSHTATTGVPTANAAPGFGGTFQVNQISSDSQGHVILNKAQTITIPATEASTSTKGLMTKKQVGDLNKAITDIEALLDALTWK